MITIVLPEWGFWLIFGMLLLNLIVAGLDLFYRRRLKKIKERGG